MKYLKNKVRLAFQILYLRILEAFFTKPSPGFQEKKTRTTEKTPFRMEPKTPFFQKREDDISKEKQKPFLVFISKIEPGIQKKKEKEKRSLYI